MSLRTRLVLVFLLLAVVPLGALVLYSYSSSLAAVRQAVEAEAEVLTREMETRMERIAQSLDERVQRLSDLPAEAWMQPDRQDLETLNRRIAQTLGEEAAYLDALEFVPAVAIAPADVAGAREVPDAPDAPDGPDAPAVPNTATQPDSSPRTASTQTFRVEMEQEQGQHVMRWMRQVEGGLGDEGKVVFETLAEFPTAVVFEQVAGQVAGRMAERVAANLGTVVGGIAQPADRQTFTFDDLSLEIQLPQVPAPPPPAAVRPFPPVPRARPQEIRPAAAERVLELREGLDCEMHQDGLLVGHLKAKLKAKQLLWRVLTETDREEGEIPFALDTEGRLYVADEAHRTQIEALVDPLLDPLLDSESDHQGQELREERDGWIVVTREDPNSGVRFGLAHPMADSLERVRSTAARNFGWGLALIGLCFGGILPLSGRMTRNLQDLTDGTERLAQGDLDVRVPVRSKDEVGRLALNFNRMAEELKGHQQQLLKQERLRKEQEMERRLLEAENHRKSEELEEARNFQLSLLPRELPRVPGLELAVSMTTATEVGGDYYDIQHDPDRDPAALTLAVGDATGHGTAAGTMVTVLKSLFIARGAATAPAEFLTEAGTMIRCMELGRRAMALALLAFEGSGEGSARHRRVTISSAGMPPVLRHRPDGSVEEIALEGLPLGASTKIEGSYDERTLDLESGDTLLVMTDGFPELLDGTGEPLGYERARELFAEAAGTAGTSQEVVDRLTTSCRSWRGERALADDITFLVARVG